MAPVALGGFDALDKGVDLADVEWAGYALKVHGGERPLCPSGGPPLCLQCRVVSASGFCLVMPCAFDLTRVGRVAELMVGAHRSLTSAWFLRDLAVFSAIWWTIRVFGRSPSAKPSSGLMVFELKPAPGMCG